MLEQVAAHRALDGGAQLPGLPGLLADGRHGRRAGNLLQRPHQLLRLLDVDEAPGDDLRLAEELAVLEVQYDHHHAVLGQDLPVPQHHRAHVAHAAAVHQHGAGGGRIVGDLDGLGGQLDDAADLRQHNVLPVHAHLHGQIHVAAEHLLLPVEGDEEPGLGQGVNDLQLLLAGVAGDVEGIGLVVDYVHPLAEELVDDSADGLFVARDGAGGDDDTVPGAHVDLPVLGEGHAVQGAHLLPLAACGHQHLLVQGQALDLVEVRHRVLGQLHVAQLRCHPHDVLHAPAGHRHLPSAGRRRVDDLLDAVDVGGEGGDDDALLAAGEEPVKGLAHDPLAHGVPRPLHVGGVRQQGQHPLPAQLPEAAQVDNLAVNGGGVDLEVPGVDEDAHAGVDGEGHGVGDGVVDVDELHIELAHPDHLPGLHGGELGLLEKAVLLQLQLDEPRREPGAVYGHVHLAQDVGDGPDMVLVSVSDEQSPDTALVLDEICGVGDNQINAVHVPVREAHAAVHHDDLSAVLVDGHILADLVEAAKRDDFHFFCQDFALLFDKSVEFQG